MHTFFGESAAMSTMGHCKAGMFDSEEYITNIQVGNNTIIKSELRGKKRVKYYNGSKWIRIIINDYIYALGLGYDFYSIPNAFGLSLVYSLGISALFPIFSTIVNGVMFGLEKFQNLLIF